MVEVYKNVVSSKEIKILAEYACTDDDRVDDRPDIRSKHPRWNVDTWPQTVVENIFNRVLDQAWYANDADTLFLENRIQGKGLGIHVDSGNFEPNLYKGVLIPIICDNTAATVFFKNYWTQESCRFSRKIMSPFAYSMQSIDGMIEIPDIRVLLDQCKNNPETVDNFIVDEKFIANLEQLVMSRSGNLGKRTSDYSQIIGYDPSLKFDASLHKQYMNHIDLESLHGLTIDKIVEWEVGSVIVFPRTQIHCAAAKASPSRRIGLTVFTFLAE
jgi:hypothetical protein